MSPPPYARPSPTGRASGPPSLHVVNGGKSGWAKPASVLEAEARERERQADLEEQARVERQVAQDRKSESAGPGKGRRTPYVHEPYSGSTVVLVGPGEAPVLVVEAHAGMVTQTHKGLLDDLTARMRALGASYGILATQAIVMAVYVDAEVLAYEGIGRTVRVKHTGTTCLGSTAALWKLAEAGHPLAPVNGLSGFLDQALKWVTCFAEKGKVAHTSINPEACLLSAALLRAGELEVRTYRNMLLPLPSPTPPAESGPQADIPAQPLDAEMA